MKKGFVLLVFIAALSIVLIAPASAQIEFIEPTASAADETARDVSPEFAGIVADLAASGKIPGTNGEYYYLDNFSDEWAQLQWYQWIRRSGITMTNFVLRSKIQYESASDTPNWGDSGCGWYFRGKDTNNHLTAYYAMDGNVRVIGYKEGRLLSYGQKSVGASAVRGDIDFVLYANGKNVGVLINGAPALERDDVVVDDIESALFSVTFSGTNKDFGIRCRYSEVEFMVLP